jgi:hypothetical protein
MNASQSWKGKISNIKQLGGIETSVIDNGQGRGNRIAWINTGSGLRYKIVIDRAMDIAEAFYNQHSIAWLSGLGVSAPQPFSDRGLNWLRTFGGGLLVTCGLTHIGAPESDEWGERGLHGAISNIPAEIESIIQPDPLSGNMEMSITGTIKQVQIFGPSIELKRTISGTLGKPHIRIHDEIVNRGNTTVPHMILYHCNFGWPLADEGADLIWSGNWTYSRGDGKEEIFKESNNFRKCPAPMKSHEGAGEEVAFIDINHDENNYSYCGLHNSKIGIAVAMKFKKDQLPWLTNWQHWAEGEYVTGLEPGNNPCWGQAKARKEEMLVQLAPGEKKNYDLEIEVLHDENAIKEFIKKAS